MTTEQDQTHKRGTIVGLLVFGIVLLLVGIAYFFYHRYAESLGLATDRIQVQPVNVSGSGRLNTKTFALAGGSYTAHLAGTGKCNYALSIVDSTDSTVEFESGSLKTAGAIDTNLYSVPAGVYYLHADTGLSPSCPWTVNIRPQ